MQPVTGRSRTPVLPHSERFPPPNQCLVRQIDNSIDELGVAADRHQPLIGE
jgi:hypothetical protein